MPLRANAMAKKVTKVIYFYCSDIHFIQFEAARPEHAGHLNATNERRKKGNLIRRGKKHSRSADTGTKRVRRERNAANEPQRTCIKYAIPHFWKR